MCGWLVGCMCVGGRVRVRIRIRVSVRVRIRVTNLRPKPLDHQGGTAKRRPRSPKQVIILLYSSINSLL